MDIAIPALVPAESEEEYKQNYELITRGTGRLMLFAGDQKVEHLNDDFFGEGIAAEDADPEHLFKIASQATIGCFATQLGLISRYGKDYKDISYLVKLNSKTPLVKSEQMDPLSLQWYGVDQVAEFKENSGLPIVGVGYTIYLGSEFERDMLREAAQTVAIAHEYGLVTVLWIYPRGKAVGGKNDELLPHLIAGATGVAACLGTDFVKVNYPKEEGKESKEIFKEAIQAAGRTKVVCAGGSTMDATKFLQKLHDQIHVSGASGNATGRNIHQRPLDEAVRLCNAISAITLGDWRVADAVSVYEGSKKFKL
jgi:fructose-bisphosphate aldolase/6-deoxy-5-ketofructose 1-phosphate synthase